MSAPPPRHEPTPGDAPPRPHRPPPPYAPYPPEPYRSRRLRARLKENAVFLGILLGLGVLGLVLFFLLPEAWYARHPGDLREAAATASHEGPHPQRSARPPASSAGTVSFSVQSTPEDATVFLDGDALGRTPLDRLSLREGVYIVSLKKENYYSFDTLLVLGDEPRASFSFSLRARTDPQTDLQTDPQTDPQQAASSPAAPPSNVASELLAVTRFEELIDQLRRHQNLGHLTFGNAEDFLRPAQCYVFVVDPGREEVVAVLAPGPAGRTDLRSGAEGVDLPGRYAGHVAIWVDFYR